MKRNKLSRFERILQVLELLPKLVWEWSKVLCYGTLFVIFVIAFFMCILGALGIIK